MRLTFAILLLLIPFCDNIAQCRRIDFEEGVKRKLISEGLFNTSINSDFLGCPRNISGDSSLCGHVQNTHADYDIGLPDAIFFTVFLTSRHYNFCKSVFSDPFFQQSLINVPMPSAEAIAWYDKWKNFTVSFLHSDEKPTAFEALDDVQKKVITFLHAVKSWTYCPMEQYGPMGITHATFDAKSNIIVYRSACKTPDVYEANISETALLHRLFFVCAHEVAHVIDRTRGALIITSAAERGKAERRANVNGLILTLAFSKILNEMLREYQQVVKQATQKAPCDEYYLSAMIKKWNKVEKYLILKIEVAKKIYDKEQSPSVAFRKNKEWTLWACMTMFDDFSDTK